MTSRSRKKRPTTAPKSTPATPSERRRPSPVRSRTWRSAAVALAVVSACGTDAILTAQQPTGNLRPVPKFEAVVQPQPHQATREGWNLKWRTSDQVAPPARQVPPAGQTVRQVSGTASERFRSVDDRRGLSIRTAEFMDQPNVPVADATPNRHTPSGSPDFFADPFGDDRQLVRQVADRRLAAEVADDLDDLFSAPPESVPTDSPEPQSFRSPEQTIDPLQPNERRPMNQLRDTVPGNPMPGNPMPFRVPDADTPFAPPREDPTDRIEPLPPPVPEFDTPPQSPSDSIRELMQGESLGDDQAEA